MGQVFDRTGGRILILLVRACMLGLVTIALYWTNNFLFFIFVFGVLASVAQSGLSLTNTSALLSRWFVRLRGTVIGINSTALSHRRPRHGALRRVPDGRRRLAHRLDRLGLAWCCLSLPMAWFFYARESGPDEPPPRR